MARIEFEARYFGDSDGQGGARRVTIEAPVDMVPLAASSSTGDPVAQRVRATVTSADAKRLTGTGWTDGTVTDGGRTVTGKISLLELIDDTELEFLLTPSV